MRLIPPASLRSLSGLCLMSLSLTACFGNRTADEEVIEVLPNVALEPDAGSDAASPTPDAGSNTVDCSEETDLIARFICSAGAGGGGLEDIIGGLLGGGAGGMSCARETDPIAQLLCQFTSGGGGGIEGLIGDLLGGGEGLGGLLEEGGIERIVTGALVEVMRGLIDDLIGSLFGGAEGEGGGFLGGLGGDEANVVGTADFSANKARGLYRSAEQCQSARQDDLLTRLVCARQALDVIAATLPSELSADTLGSATAR